MKATAIVLGAALLCAMPVRCQIPDQFVLHQNDPNPFCPTDSPGGTIITFEIAHVAYARMEVLTPDTLSVVRVLLYGYQAPGLHAVVWDGRDETGDPVEEGAYPYVLTARDSTSGPVIFQDTLLATAACASPVEQTSWGRIKMWHRDGNW
ncbi:MAG: hypothetical protein JXB46_06195 [Candidatus Eisenbacteria bacterium]|nr:hypothetical protein [Candidatus Eisenbacteria bacterium]